MEARGDAVGHQVAPPVRRAGERREQLEAVELEEDVVAGELAGEGLEEAVRVE